ncbi:MAG: DivIVA domain-containing protein [Desulfitobacteriaceae bacterium]
MNLERPKFKRVMRGYDREQVEQSWAEMARMVSEQNAASIELKLQINSLKEQNTEWGNRLKNYEKMENDLRDALISAQRIAKQVKEEAEQKAEEIISSARMEVETILSEAREEAQKREEEANRQLSEKQIKLLDIEDEIDELTSMKEELKQKVERTTNLLGSIQHTLQELLHEE